MVEEKNCTENREDYLKFFDRYDHTDFCLAYAFTYRDDRTRVDVLMKCFGNELFLINVNVQPLRDSQGLSQRDRGTGAHGDRVQAHAELGLRHSPKLRTGILAFRRVP